MTQNQVEKLEGMLLVKENAKEMYTLADALFKSASMALDKEGMMVSDYYRAYYFYYFKNNVSKAINYAKSALSEANELKNTKYITASADLVGVLCLRKYEIYNALEPLLLSYSLATKTNDKRGIVSTTLHLGDIFFALKDYERAFKYYVDARDIAMRNEIAHDTLLEEVLFKHIVTSIMLNKIEILDSTIKIAIANFDGAMQAPFIALKEILSLLKRLQYIERSIVEDIYAIFIKIDDIESSVERARVALLLSALVERTDDTDLIIDYTELLDTYKMEVKNINLKEEIESVKATLLGFDTDSEQALGYALILTNKNSLLSDALDLAVKKILELQTAEVERDKEIKKNKELQHISEIDELTSIYNRRSGVLHIEEALNDKSKESYAFIMLDFDNFKQINDNFGHAVGDETLQFLSSSLKSIFDKDSICARLGGDEFVILLYNLPTEFEIRKRVAVYKVNTLIDYLLNTKLECLNNNSISVSCGVALEGGDFDSLYQKSDIALYSSKAAGKGQVTVYDSTNDEKQENSNSDTSKEEIKVTGNISLEDAHKAEEERKIEASRKILLEKAAEEKARLEAKRKEAEEARLAEERRLKEIEATRKKTEEEIEAEAETEVIGENNDSIESVVDENIDDNNSSTDELDQLLNSFSAVVEETEEIEESEDSSDEDEEEDDSENTSIMHLDPREILRKRREAILKAANMDMDDDDDDDDDDEDEEDSQKPDPKELLRKRREAIRAKAMAASKASNVDDDDVNGEDDEPDDEEEE